MSWNYRLCKRKVEFPHPSDHDHPTLEYGIYAVYYNNDGTIFSHSQEPEKISDFGYEDDNMTDDQAKKLFKEQFKKMEAALKKDVVDLDNIVWDVSK